MESHDFTAVLEITDSNLIKQLDNLNDIKTNNREMVGRYDSLNKLLKLNISRDEFRIKLDKKRNRKRNFLLEIDNSDYINFSNYTDFLAQYKKQNRGRRPDKKNLSLILEKQKEEQHASIEESRKSNKRLNITLGWRF